MVRPRNQRVWFLYHVRTRGGRAISKQLKDKLGFMAIELAMVGLFWWFFKLVPALGLTLVGAVLLSGLAPERFSRLASGLALLGVGAVFYFYFKHRELGMILGAGGLLLTIWGAAALASERKPTSE